MSQSDFHRLTHTGDPDHTDKEAHRGARLPEGNNKKMILTGLYNDNDWTIDIYSLSDHLEPNDRLRLYSLESLPGDKSIIRQTFSISDNYRFTVYKHLNGTLIERLTYILSPDGIFEELRDGKTTTVAFDSYDGVNFLVRTFIWERNHSGGLSQKDLTTENYLLDQNGNLTRSFQ